jgi:hyperosmotically inducible periplasmic protein
VHNGLEVKRESTTENSDVRLTTKVKTMLLFHRNVSAMTEVNTKDRIISLRGEAASQAQKDLTTEYARDVEGVKKIKDEMTVTKTSKEVQTTGEMIDDAALSSLDQCPQNLGHNQERCGYAQWQGEKRG